MSDTKEQSKDSALNNILKAGLAGAASPSNAAQIAGAFAPSGAEEAAAQGIQAAVNVGVASSREFMNATIRQHGRSPSAVLQDMKIQQALNTHKVDQSATNKGIEAVRQKAEVNKSETSSSQSKNKGIESYHSKSSGQSSSSSNSNASSTSKGSSANSGGQSSGSGQQR